MLFCRLPQSYCFRRRLLTPPVFSPGATSEASSPARTRVADTAITAKRAKRRRLTRAMVPYPNTDRRTRIGDQPKWVAIFSLTESLAARCFSVIRAARREWKISAAGRSWTGSDVHVSVCLPRVVFTNVSVYEQHEISPFSIQT